jgi:hypothetical protein
LPAPLAALFLRLGRLTFDDLARVEGADALDVVAGDREGEQEGQLGFRRRHFPPDREYQFKHIDDMSSLSIFEGATNQTAVLVADKRESRGSNTPVSIWKGDGTATIPTSLELDAVAGMTRRREYAAEPVDPADSGSPLLMMPRYGLEASRPLRRASYYLDAVRNGIHTRGANGIFFVDVLGDEDGLTRIRNVAGEGRNREVEAVEGVVESAVTRSLLKGADVAPGSAVASLGTLFFHDEAHVSTPMLASEVSARFPRAFDYMQNFESHLRARRRFRNFDPSGEEWLGIYSVTTAALAEHKVVVREIARGLVAAPVHGANVIPDHKLYVIPCSDHDEAERLSAALNSRVVHYLVLSFSVSTSITGSFLRYVGIPNLSVLVEPDDPEESLAQALGLTREQLQKLDSIARTELEYLQTSPRAGRSLEPS